MDKYINVFWIKFLKKRFRGEWEESKKGLEEQIIIKDLTIGGLQDENRRLQKRITEWTGKANTEMIKNKLQLERLVEELRATIEDQNQQISKIYIN